MEDARRLQDEFEVAIREAFAKLQDCKIRHFEVTGRFTLAGSKQPTSAVIAIYGLDNVRRETLFTFPPQP